MPGIEVLDRADLKPVWRTNRRLKLVEPRCPYLAYVPCGVFRHGLQATPLARRSPTRPVDDVQARVQCFPKEWGSTGCFPFGRPATTSR